MIVTVGPSERKSERTRRAILEAARVHFATRGFDGANLRAIGAEASIDPSMVMRYFGSKEGLFAALVDIELQLPDLTQVSPADHGLTLTRHFVRRWEGDLSDDVLVMLLRSAVTNDKVAEQLRIFASGQIVSMLEPVVDPETLQRRAGLVMSQMLGIAITRYILALPSVVERPAELLVLDVAPTIQRYLHGILNDDKFDGAR
jgi:AcrR family transcriptional regulator